MVGIRTIFVVGVVDGRETTTFPLPSDEIHDGFRMIRIVHLAGPVFETLRAVPGSLRQFQR